MTIQDRAMTIPVELRYVDGEVQATLTDPTTCALVMGRVSENPDAGWNFCGTSYEEGSGKQHPLAYYFTYGGQYARERVGNATYSYYPGGLEMRLEIVGEYDGHAARTLAYWAFMSRVGARITSTNMLVLAPNESCKVCQTSLKSGDNLEWRICRDCTDSCDHDYREGLGQYKGTLTSMVFCDTCGQADPEWRPFANSLEGVLDAMVKTDLLSAVLLDHGDGTSTLLTKRD